MPPTHFEGGKVNMFQPYVVGQSGTARPEPVLVTRLPASTRSTVQPATNFAKRWSISGQEGRERQEGRPILPFLPRKLVAGCALGRRLERERDFLGFLFGDRDLLLLR